MRKFIRWQLHLTGLIMVLGTAVKAQPSITYTQYMDNPVPFNPAYSLTNNYGSVNFSARKQWLGVPGSPTQFLFNTDFPLTINGAKGGVVAWDNSTGVEHATQINGFFAKSIQLSDDRYFGVSINAGLRYYGTAYGPLDPHDPAIQNDISQIRPSVGISTIFYGSYYYLGFSAPDITFRSPSNTDLQDNNNFRNHYYFSGGLTSELDDGFKLKPALLAYFSRGIPPTVDVSTKLCMKDVFAIGVNYRSTQEVAALFSIDEPLFHMGYSYQFGVSNSNISSFGNSTQEITITLLFGKGNQTAINPGGK